MQCGPASCKVKECVSPYSLLSTCHTNTPSFSLVLPPLTRGCRERFVSACSRHHSLWALL